MERHLDLAVALADGEPIDWSAASSSSQSEFDRDLLLRLQCLQRVVDGHEAIRSRTDASRAMSGNETLLTECRRRHKLNDTGPLQVQWGPLVVLEKIGSGSFGDVYRAWDPRLEREVALKLIPAEASDTAGSPVIEEGRLLAKIRHPNVLTVHGAERIDGRVGIWTEYVRGETLAAEVKRRGPLPPADAARIGVEVCRALSAVHGAGVLHADVKAHNVMREPDGRVVLADFGTGALLDEHAGVGEPRVAGTPLYMAPEVLGGTPGSVAADLYSVGVLLYFLLTGDHPVRGRTLAEIRRAHAERQSVPLDRARLDVPPDLLRIVETLLAREPERRYETAASAEAAFGAWLALHDAPRSDATGGRTLVRSRVVFGTVVAICLSAVVAGVLWRRPRSADTAAQPISDEPRVISLDTFTTFPGNVSRDGRFVPYFERQTQDLFLRDLSTGANRLIVKGVAAERGGTGGYPVLSPNGHSVIFDRHLPKTAGEVELNIAALQGNAAPLSVRRLLAFKYSEAGEIAPRDMSPDGEWIAALVLRPGNVTQLGLVPVHGGEFRVLKTLAWGFPRNIFFSPDSKYIAYSLEVRDSRNDQDVLVMAVDDSRENVVVHHSSNNVVLGWAPDGQSLLFGSDRNGAFSLWRQPIEDGASRGSPTLVRTGLGDNPVSLGVTTRGAVFVWQNFPTFYIQVAPIDLDAGTLTTDGPGTFRIFVHGGGKPAWSPDGKSLAYRVCPLACARTERITIRDMANEQQRELPMRLRYLQGPADLAWSPNGKSLMARATDMKGRVSNYLIDPQTGDFEVDPGLGPNAGTNVTPDGKRAYLPIGGAIVERDLAAKQDRVVFPDRAAGNSVLINSSPDRRFTAFIETSATNASTLFVMPYGGGKPRELLRGSALNEFGRNAMTWTPDSRSVLLMRRVDGRQELWLIPAAFPGAARRLDIDVGNWQVTNQSGGFRLRPGGREIAFVAGEEKDYVSVLGTAK